MEFSLPEQKPGAVTLHFETAPRKLTSHPESRTSSFIAEGNRVARERVPNATRTDRWYFITTLEVRAAETSRVVVILVDSLTDARGSTTHGHDRWRYDSGDKIHLNPSGCRALVDAVDPSLFERWARGQFSSIRPTTWKLYDCAEV